MGFWHRTFYALSTISLGVMLAGCEPSPQSGTDDEREPHYVLGQKRFNAMDYAGAAEAFEEALEANPRSAPAHYQLAMLYSGAITNPAAAIYHYEQYLRFDPNAGNAEVVTGRIAACKLQLAQGLLDLPSSPAVLRQLQQLADKNRQLQDEVDKWHAYYASQQAAARTNQPPATGSPAPQPAPTAVASASAGVTPSAPVTQPRTHTVIAGETLAAIARKYKVNLNALLAANPGLNPRKMRVGQVINLPSP